MIRSALVRTASLVLLGALPLLATQASPAQAAVASKEYSVSMAPTQGPSQLGTTAARQSMVNAKRAGVNTITFVYEYCQSNQFAAIMYRCPNTPTDAALQLAGRHARGLGLKVAVAFHQEASNGQWRGSFCPNNRAAWFSNYQSQLVKVGRVLQGEHVNEFVIGGEMPCLTVDAQGVANATRWRSVIRSVRAVYGGRLAYSAQRDAGDKYSELDRITFWDALDVIGVSAYYPLVVSGSPTVSTLRQRWNAIATRSFEPVSVRWHKPLLLTEVGYRSIRDARLAPWDYRRQAALDLAEQARDYEALLGFVKSNSVVAGVHLWSWSPDPHGGGMTDTGYSPQGKPAETMMRRQLLATS